MTIIGHKSMIEEAEKFKITGTNGIVSKCVGIQINRTNDNKMCIHQSEYTFNLLKIYGMNDSRPVPTPMNEGMRLS